MHAAEHEYRTARTLATIEHLGETFRITRRRLNGKPWRRYLALLYGNYLMSGSTFPDTTDPKEGAAFFSRILERTFKTPEDMRLALDEIVGKIQCGHAP